MTPIQTYIHEADPQVQEVLTEMYQLIQPLIPEATEKISYDMPTFFLTENLVHFAPAKRHLGFYPTPSAIEQFKNQLSDYKTSKGAIQFPYSQPLPKALIQQIVHFRKEQVSQK